MATAFEPVLRLNRILRAIDPSVFSHPSLIFAGSSSPEVRVDFISKPDCYILNAELPGLQKEAIKIQLEGSKLILSGEKHRSFDDKDPNIRSVEFQEGSWGLFSRTIHLPKECDPSTVSARYENGILHLTIKKLVPEAKTYKEIKIK